MHGYHGNLYCGSQEKRCTYKIKVILAACYHGLLKMVPNWTFDMFLQPMDRDATYLICIFMNFNEILKFIGGKHKTIHK